VDDLKWIECRIHTSYEAQEAIANILHELGVSGIVIEDSDKGEKTLLEGIYIKAYLPKDHLLEEKILHIEKAIENIHQSGINTGSCEMTFTEIANEDWATSWQKYYQPINISPNMKIVPTWEDVKKEHEEQVVIELDPGLAFGTGSHATTALCLRALESNVKKGDTIIDVGCGSGILSIASILLGAAHVLAIDEDEVAIKSTQQNAVLNDVSQWLTTKQSNLLSKQTYIVDLIVSNILAEVIVSFAHDAWTYLLDGGLFITSGIIERKSEQVIDTLKDVGFKIVHIDREDGWVCIIAQK